MVQDTPTDPKVPATDAAEPGAAPSQPALPEFLGRGEDSPPTPPSDDGRAPTGLRIVLVAVAMLGVGFLLYREAAVDHAEGETTGLSTEYDWEVVTPDGTPVDLSDYKGRPILLNVWATWCPPCLIEMPSLAALSKRPELKEAGVAIVLVSSDGALEPVQQFLQRVDLGDSDVLLAAGPPPREFDSPGIPATYFVAPDGRITRREFGPRDWDSPEFASELVALANGG